jgi:hypothetical protein
MLGFEFPDFKIYLPIQTKMIQYIANGGITAVQSISIHKNSEKNQADSM